MFDYGEACPISKASSVLCERWTLQIIREMFLGATRFSEFQKYLPKLSPTLLNSRLRSLEQNGIVMRKKIPEKTGYEYQLTAAGKELKPLLSEFGKWGMTWVFDSMDDDELNISAIVRDFAGALNLEKLPAGDCTIQMTIEGEQTPVKNFIMVREEQTQVCDDNIGHDVDVYLTADLKTFYKIWFGETSVEAARKKEQLKVVGSSAYTKNLSKWLLTSQFAPYNRNKDE